jgi:uncharacterized protein (DUF488 family)
VASDARKPQEQERRRVWTIGHSTLEQGQLIALLQAYGIRCLVDVRSFPRSRKNPQSNREELEAALPAAGLRYVWMGKEIGGFRKGGYEAYTLTPTFAEGVAALERLAAEVPTAFMCAEKLFFRCHRRFIADELVRRGWTVIHVHDAARSQPHRLRPMAPELPFAPSGRGFKRPPTVESAAHTRRGRVP